MESIFQHYSPGKLSLPRLIGLILILPPPFWPYEFSQELFSPSLVSILTKYSLKYVSYDGRNACPLVYGLSLVGRASRLSYLLKGCFRVSSLTANYYYLHSSMISRCCSDKRSTPLLVTLTPSSQRNP